MSKRPFLKLPKANEANKRITGKKLTIPGPKAKHSDQIARNQNAFFAVQKALTLNKAQIADDPQAFSPDRVLVFELANSIPNIRNLLKNLAPEFRLLGDSLQKSDSKHPDLDKDENSRLYAAMPTADSLKQLLKVWEQYTENKISTDLKGWKKLFTYLIDLRVYGPKDRMVLGSFAALSAEQRNVVELELWDSANKKDQHSVIKKIDQANGTVLAESWIEEPGFTYKAIKVRFPNGTFDYFDGSNDSPATWPEIAELAPLEAIYGQSAFIDIFEENAENDEETWNTGSPATYQSSDCEIAIFDSRIAANTNHLIGHKIVNEDLSDVGSASDHNWLKHGTAMTSLVLNGDLNRPAQQPPALPILFVPVLKDQHNRLFIDVLHTALRAMFTGSNAKYPNIYVINFSIGLTNRAFDGRSSKLAEFLDWASKQFGVLFVVSAGNVTGQNVNIQSKMPGMSVSISEHLKSLSVTQPDRRLFAPAEAMNVLSVGAIGLDDRATVQPNPNHFLIGTGTEAVISPISRLGPGINRAIKPDVLHLGGQVSYKNQIPNLQPVKSANAGLLVPHPSMLENPRLSVGTSDAAALTTRAIALAIENIVAGTTNPDSAFHKRTLTRRDKCLLGRLLAVHSARSPQSMVDTIIGNTDFGTYHTHQKAELAKQVGYGQVDEVRMQGSPESGVTFLALDEIAKDQEQRFNVPFPDDLKGKKFRFRITVTLCWISSVDGNITANYRQNALKVVALGADGSIGSISKTGFLTKVVGAEIDNKAVNKGTVVKHVFVGKQGFNADQHPIWLAVQSIPVQNSISSQSQPQPFAIAVSLEITEANQLAQSYDVLAEVKAHIRPRVQTRV